MKKSPLFLALMLTGLLTVACGSDDDDNGSRVQREEDSKDLFSVWRSDEEDAIDLDLRQYTFNREALFAVRTASNILCTCNIEFDGTQSSGEVYLRDCVGINACLDLIDTYTYEKTQDTLLVCDSQRDCTTYR